MKDSLHAGFTYPLTPIAPTYSSQALMSGHLFCQSVSLLPWLLPLH